MAIVLPALTLLAHLTQRSKEVGVEQLAAQRADKALNVGILGQTCALNPVQLNVLALALGLQHLAE